MHECQGDSGGTQKFREMRKENVKEHDSTGEKCEEGEQKKQKSSSGVPNLHIPGIVNDGDEFTVCKHIECCFFVAVGFILSVIATSTTVLDL